LGTGVRAAAKIPLVILGLCAHTAAVDCLSASSTVSAPGAQLTFSDLSLDAAHNVVLGLFLSNTQEYYV
jgi:hypothetical protein